MHDSLFSEQNLVAQERFSDIARKIGVDVAAFEDCMLRRATREEVARDAKDATSLGLNFTPTFFVNGALVVGALPYDRLREMIESELNRSQTPPNQ